MSNKTALNENDIEAFLTKLKQSDNDKKVDQIQSLGLQLEETSELPNSTLDAITLTIAPLLRSTSHLLVSSLLLSFIPFYLPFIPSSTGPHLQVALHQFLPPLLDKLNDPKERISSPASQSVTILGRKCYEAEQTSTATQLGQSTTKGKEKETPVGYWERNVKDVMAGKGWRGKVECMKMLLVMRTEENSRLSLKPWLAPLVDLLEDGDGNVRDQAKETVVALLAPASTPSAAKTELKKLLQARNVRKTIADGILARVLSSGPTTTATEITPEAAATGDETSNGGVSRSGTATPAGDEIDIVRVASGKDLESEFAQMFPYFEGKETEHNWLQREKSVIRIRGLLRGQAFSKHPDSFVSGLKAGGMEGVTKTLMSLRTTVAQQSCAAVQELAEYLGVSFDPFVENLLPVLGKMAGFTKKIVAERSQRCVTAILTHCSNHPRIFVAHISAGINDKNVQTRQYSTAHLKTFVDIHGNRSKNAIESTPTVLDTLEGCTKKGLADVNPQVRDTARAAFWSFNSIWPARGAAILDSLDATARKQLDKVNPQVASGSIGSAAPSRPAIKKPAASSAMAAILAEKRKAKAAELAAGRMAQETARTVSSPIPASPLMQQKPRTTSSQLTPAKRSALGGGTASPQRSPNSPGLASPTPASSIPRNTPAESGSTTDLLQRSRSSSLVKTRPQSPSLSHGSPTATKSPLHQHDTPAGLSSPGSSSSGRASLKTPVLQHATLPKEDTHGLEDFSAGTPPATGVIDRNSLPTLVTSGSVDPTLKAQAVQAETAAQQLLAVDKTDSNSTAPVTPARPATNGAINGRSGVANLYKTPISNLTKNGSPSRAPWEDSPRPEAMTPLLFAQLKERKHERSWWLKRQELMDKASPLKLASPDAASAMLPDVQELESGLPSLRSLQKLALFVESHSLVGDEEDVEEAEKVWAESKLFDRVFDGLMDFLSPSKPIDLLEQGLVLLWEMARNQWRLFEDRDDALVDALFRLRATPNIIIHESTNSLLSLMCEVSEPLFLFAVLQSGLARYLSAHPADESGKNGVYTGLKARASGYLFGLTGIGMCILHMSPDVVRIEAPKLAPLMSEALGQDDTSPRQAANMVILAIQAVLLDAQMTMSLLELTDTQKNFAMFLMNKNALSQVGNTNRDSEGEPGEEGRETVAGEMVKLLGKATRRQD